MSFRTKTSKQTMEIFKTFETRDHLQPFILAKLAISLSIRAGFRFDASKIPDSLGIDLNRQTITGEFDSLFKALIELNEEKHLSDEQFFPTILKSYLDNGAILLDQEYKYSNDFFIHLVELEKGI